MVANDVNFDSIDFTIQTLILLGFKNILLTPQVPTPNLYIDTKKVINKVNDLHSKYANTANITTQGFCDTVYCDHTCNAGIGRLLIDTKGNVYPCAPIHKPCKLGTINTDINILKERGKDFYNSYPQESRKICKGFLDLKI